jgi:hypothetical protein
MTDVVECAECGSRYDSDANAFCPRCGSLQRGQATKAALSSARVAHPRRRRAQVGGIMLLVLGSLWLLQFGVTAALAPEPDASQLEALRSSRFADVGGGGDLHLRLLDNGTPLAGVIVSMVGHGESAATNLTTSASGWANFTRLPSAFVTVAFEATVGNATNATVYQRHAYVPATDRVVVREELSRREAGDDVPWSAPGLRTLVRILSSVLALVSAIAVAGGVAALRLRAYGWALTGGFVALIPAAFALTAAPNLIGFLDVLLVALAIGFIIAGHAFFGRKK